VVPAEPDEYVVRGPVGFGAAVKEFRFRREMSQQQLAELADVHRTSLSALETGMTTEALKRLMQVLAALDLEVVVREKGRS